MMILTVRRYTRDRRPRCDPRRATGTSNADPAADLQ